MSRKLLHIIATPRGLASNTGRVSSALLEALQDRYDDLEVASLDLFSADLPAVAGANIKSKYALMTGQAIPDEARDSWRRIEQAIEQFLEADLLVVTAPMWNFGVPYALKYYIDAIVQPGYLFEYDQSGQPHGLVHGRRMACVTSRGGDYSRAPLAQLDFLESYLRSIFGFVGIVDIDFFNAQPMDVSAGLRRSALQAASSEVRDWVEAGSWDESAGHALSPAELREDLEPSV